MVKTEVPPIGEFNTEFEDPFSKEVWESTYKNHNDKTINDTLFRVAKAAASVEKTDILQEEWTLKFYDLLSGFKATSGGRIYSNAGTEWNGTTLMNCFVSPRRKNDIDSLDGILESVKNQSFTLKSEGGWGENFSYIRPRGFFIHGIGVETPGAVKYMEIFDKTSEIITAGAGKKAQNKKAKGKIRKGAMMGVLDCIAGSSLVDTIEGKIQLKDLVDTRPFLYCTDGNGNVFIRQANKVWSKGIKKTIKVGFDNGDFIECTDDHEFLLTDGSYKKAKSLKMGDSLAALTRRLHGNYLYAGVAGSKKQVADHNLVYEMKYGDFPTALTNETRNGSMTIGHHIDHNTINNHPDNIISMTISEHSKHHSNILLEHQKRITNARRGKTWEEYYGKEKANKIKEKQSKSMSKKIPWNKGKSGEEYKPHYTNGFSNQFEENKNHKVIYVQDSIEQEVFDISMPDPYHNFSVNEVFVHNCWHPDIIEFISAKQQPGRLTKFNISVNCTDEFMGKILKVIDMGEMKASKAEIEQVDTWELKFPDTTFEKYKPEWDGNLYKWEENGYPVIVSQTISASFLWNLIMESTYNRAEPGVLFLDRANYFGPLSYKENISATNPCGEQMLAPGGVCNLASLNLTQFVNKDRNGFDITAIKKYVKYMVRFLDNISDLSSAPLKEYVTSMRDKRRIGIGILGWGSSLFMLKVRFGSDDAASLRDEIMGTIARESYMCSIDLAIEKGMFKECIPEKHAVGPFIKGLDLPKSYILKLLTTGIRNSSLLSIQPTGNTSIQANVVSGGLEPIFMPEYVRTVIVNTMPDEIAEVTPVWYEGEWHETSMFKFVKEGDEEILRGVSNSGTVYKIDKSRGLTKEVICEDYGVRYLKKLGEWDADADWAVTTTNLSVEDHVNDLKGFARWVDSAMSKTVNVPQNYPFEKFQNIYLDSYRSGYVKGVTTYRAGSMTSVLSAKEEKDATQDDEEIIKEDVKLPDSAMATMKTIRAENRKWYLTVVYYEDNQNRPFALFVKTNAVEKGVVADDAVEHLVKLARKKKIPKRHIDEVNDKLGTDTNSSKVARLISFLLRHGVLIKNIVAVLDKVETAYVGTFVFQIKKFLSSYIKDGEKVEDEVCQECGSTTIVFSEGCKKCISCGSSKCG